jgi:hypothetical protein
MLTLPAVVTVRVITVTVTPSAAYTTVNATPRPKVASLGGLASLTGLTGLSGLSGLSSLPVRER